MKKGIGTYLCATTLLLLGGISACKRGTSDSADSMSRSPDSVSSATTNQESQADSTGAYAGEQTNSAGAQNTGATASASRDSARGIVREVGNEPMTALVLDYGSGVFSLSSSKQNILRNVIGAEISVYGTLTQERDLNASPGGAVRFNVAEFVVRSADGVAATDGVLELSGNKYSLVTANGTRIPIVELPAALKEQVGVRVYIVGPVDRPSTWGVIGAKN